MTNSAQSRSGPLSAAEVSRKHGIPKKTVTDAITRGDLPAQKLPGYRGAYILQERDVRTWLRKRAEKAERVAARRREQADGKAVSA